MKNNPKAFAAQYNKSLSQSINNGSQKMTGDQALNGFFLYSLLLHHAELGTVLVLPKDASDIRNTLHDAWEQRNTFMEGTGQELWSHACDKCCIIEKKMVIVNS